MRLAAIVAMSENRVIGNNNQLPWHLPADLQHFKRMTMGQPIIMGRKTFQSIGRALPGRCNIVLSTDPTFQAAGCVMAHSVTAALALAADAEIAFVIGGGALFTEMLPHVQCLYLTVIHEELLGDTFFPSLDLNEWEEISRIDHPADAENVYAYSFIIMNRILAHT